MKHFAIPSLATAALILLAACGATAEGTKVIRGPGADVSALKDASVPITICADTEVPTGYVVTKHERDGSCPGSSPDVSFWNAKVIQLPEDGMTVCDDSLTPPGFVRTTSVRDSYCVIPQFADITFTNAWILKQL